MRRAIASVGSARPTALSRQALAAAPSSVRFLNLHEYQSKDLLEKYNVQVQRGRAAADLDEARTVSDWIKQGNPEAELIVKAQIHAGGRGKGTFKNGYKGGVQICEDVDTAVEAAGNMMGQTLVTKQTGEEGQLCSKVLINEGITIDRELYFAILMDRAHNGPVLVASTKGGMDIEAVAEEDPDAIVTTPVPISTGLTREVAVDLAKKLEFEGAQAEAAADQFLSLYDAFIGTDATQVEINPLATGGYRGGEQGLVMAVDAKLNFDDNAAFRQQEIFAMRDKAMEDPRDVAAEEAGLNYVGLDGSIGCMVNGAGLAMATMDIIKLHGAEPANFLDVGGSATKEQVVQAFQIITGDPQVKALMVNIFGGIMRCDTIAEGIVAAARELGLKIPLVVRLEGTNVDLGKQILNESGLDITAADDLDDAAKKAVAAISA